MLKDVDIAIAGSGPAGSITGMCLARLGWRVAVFEANEFEEDHPGETLPPEINPVLRELGLWQVFQAQKPIESPGIISAWGGPGKQETDFTFNPHGPGWHIDRNQFDRMLFDAAARNGATALCGERVEFERETNCWIVRRRGAPAISARFAIDATGRNGIRIDGSRERVVDDLLLATILRISRSDHQTGDLRTLIEATPSGWWYSTCLPGNRMIAMFFTGRETYRRGEDFVNTQLEEAPLTCARVRKDRVVQVHTRVVPVTSSRRRRVNGERWLAVGDSACSLDPLSGRGIFKAVRQGTAAAKAADAALRGDAAALDGYADMVRQEFQSYIVQKESFYANQFRWRDRSFWKARSTRVKASTA